jgi:hypothetical protein
MRTKAAPLRAQNLPRAEGGLAILKVYGRNRDLGQRKD